MSWNRGTIIALHWLETYGGLPPRLRKLPIGILAPAIIPEAETD